AAFHKEDTLDLLAGGGSGKVYLFTGRGDGTFTNKVVGHGYYNDVGCSHAVGDFNNDGKLDYIFPAGRFPNSAEAEVRLNNGDDTFRTSWKFGQFQTCVTMVIGDFDGDGNLDFATAEHPDDVRIYLEDAKGAFHQGATYGVSRGAFTPVGADFNGDGKL